MAAPDFDDSAWETRALGIWNYPDHPDVQRAILRRKFTVPADWNGHIGLWLRSAFNSAFMDKGRVFVDGQIVTDWNNNGPADAELPGLKPGSSHVMAVEIKSAGTLGGTRGAAWLSNVPAPQSTLDLSGNWKISDDALHFDGDLKLPGAWDGLMARRTMPVDAAQKGNTVVLHVETDGTVGGALINGNWVRRNHNSIGPRWDLDVSRWIKFGADNKIELVSLRGPTKCKVTDARLNFYQPGIYP